MYKKHVVYKTSKVQRFILGDRFSFTKYTDIPGLKSIQKKCVNIWTYGKDKKLKHQVEVSE